jgi:hypothetical protein
MEDLQRERRRVAAFAVRGDVHRERTPPAGRAFDGVLEWG